MKEKFKATSNWNSYLPLLYAALENISGLVVEFGMGDNSTPLLHEYCDINKRSLESYETNLEWYNKYKPLENEFHKIHLVKDWDQVNVKPSLLFIDQSPGERRREDILKYANTAGVIVAHDTEPGADYGYKMRGIFKRFKYVQDFQAPGLDAWGTALSNYIDVSVWDV